MIETRNIELYFHIPFCQRKCNYCDFLSAPADDITKNAYMEAMLCEVTRRAPMYSEYSVSSIFFGGGTPTIVEPLWIERLLFAVKENYHLNPEIEITIECNPGTLTREKLQCYKKAGVNRLSIGLQSADDKELQMLGRIHNYSQFLDTYQMATEEGFANINVDLMGALPGQSVVQYEQNLIKVLALNPRPKHISAYSLIVEEGTKFGDWYEEGKLSLIDEEEERIMFHRTEEILGKEGFVHYEISNYAMPEYECKHNCGYWQRAEYLGFGIGAASMVKQVRFQNTNQLEAYINNPLECRDEEHLLSVEEQMEETMFLGLRMLKGVSVKDFYDTFGKTLEQTYGAVIQKNIADGLLTYDEKKTRLYLTEKGIDLSNYVMAQFLF